MSATNIPTHPGGPARPTVPTREGFALPDREPLTRTTGGGMR